MTAAVAEFINTTNREYERVHKEFEDQFWGTKMNLKEGTGEFTADKLSSTKRRMENFLEDAENLKKTRVFLEKTEELKPDEINTLKIFKRTFESYQMSPTAKPFREQVTKMESELEMARNGLASGYVDPEPKEGADAFVKVSSVKLRQMIPNTRSGWKRNTRRSSTYRSLFILT
eukprot:CAMPEP_0169424700 /NCGR_PEP_ID=MMETSP1017-20121227/68178_1 /TAXON_ID=342587 /ORGANISM="Karlodinium micrum, Strain CCMP2283" /LENGTH=173 /DNA_ID=CAMNT_0009534497 /DNA_START=8 /DNA_END=529 /DNA_ORIENTATION=+